MKKLVLMLVVFSMVFTSCQKEKDYYSREFVNNPPEGLEENRSQAYVDSESLKDVQFLGNYRMETMINYGVDQYGNAVVNYYNVDTDIYKIKAHKYWNWYKNSQYISTYTEDYQITSSVLEQVRKQLKNQEFIIVHKRSVSGEKDYAGLGLEIWAVNN